MSYALRYLSSLASTSFLLVCVYQASAAASNSGDRILSRRHPPASAEKAAKPSCDSSLASSPYRLSYDPQSYMDPVQSYKGDNWVCFRVKLSTQSTGCDPMAAAGASASSSCCGTDLAKVEIAVEATCKSAVTKVLLFKGFNATVVGKTRIAEQVLPVGVEVNAAVNPPTAVVRITRGLAMPQSVLAQAFPEGVPLCLNLVKRPVDEYGDAGYVCDIPTLLWTSDVSEVQYSISNAAKSCCPAGSAWVPFTA